MLWHELVPSYVCMLAKQFEPHTYAQAITLLRCHFCSSGNQGEGGILAVAFESPDSLLLTRGTAVKPVFERVKPPKGSGNKTAEIQLPRIVVSLMPPTPTVA